MIPEYIRQQARYELSRRSFWEYCKIKAPDFYTENRKYLKDFCIKLQEFYFDTKKKIIVINMPPRHGKSRTIGLFTQWLLGNNNRLKIMTGSYNETLSETFAKSVRDSILEEDGIFGKIFPKTKIKYGEASIKKWALAGNQEANYLATSPTGTATGFGCFPKGTKLFTNKGILDIKRVYKYNKNDIRVLSFDHKNDIVRYNKIMSKRRIISNEIVKLTTSSGRIIKSTRDHRYYIKGKGYVEAEKLQCGDELTIASKINLRTMWKNILQSKIRVCKSIKKRLQTHILFKRMFLQNKCSKTKEKKMCSVWKRCWSTSKILLFRMQKNRYEKSQKVEKHSMPNMSNNIQTSDSSNEILFYEMQKQSTFNKNEKGRQFKLQRWKKLYNRILRYKRKSQNKRQLSMSNMWRKRETNRKQEIWDNIEFVNTSQRQKQKKQQNGKFDNIVQTMPYHIAQNKEKIEKIEYIKTRTPVYDIQVENDENFFANGVLVHNCNLMIIDDLIKEAKEAYNERVLISHQTWFNDTMLSRTETGFKIIIVMTRWAERDLAGYILENFEDVVHINYKAVQEDGTMLCSDVLNRNDYDLKTKNMNKDIVEANYQQEPIDVKGKLYSNLLTYEYEKKPVFKYIMNYTDTADMGEDYLCSINYGVSFNNQKYILNVLYTKEPMEYTEPKTAEMLTADNVGYAKIESNNGGRGFARNVQKELQKLKNIHTKVDWFHQNENKQARILSNATGIMNNVFFPVDWETRFPEFAKDIKRYQREGKNEHDDAEDTLTGVYENSKPNGWEISNRKLI